MLLVGFSAQGEYIERPLGMMGSIAMGTFKAPFTPTGDVWRCTGDQQFWTHRQCIARRRQTTPVHCHHIASVRQPSSTLRQAWRFFWNVQKNRQASPTVASEYSVVKWLSALRQPSPSYSSSSPMRR